MADVERTPDSLFPIAPRWGRRACRVGAAPAPDETGNGLAGSTAYGTGEKAAPRGKPVPHSHRIPQRPQTGTTREFPGPRNGNQGNGSGDRDKGTARS